MCTDRRFWGDSVKIQKNRSKHNLLDDGFFRNIIKFWGPFYKESGDIFYGVIKDDYIVGVLPYDWS